MNHIPVHATDQRTCRKCGEVKPLGEFNRRSAGNQHEHTCKPCRNRQIADRYRTRARARAMKSARHRRYRERNPERACQIRNASHNRRAAIEDGKTSPITRRVGFSLVRPTFDEIHYRAARLDRPIDSGEVALCRYELIEGRWDVSLPFLVPAPFREEARRLVARLAVKEAAAGARR
jgi:hypothetical protein